MTEMTVTLSHLERTMAAAPRPFVLIAERELSVLRRGLTKDGWKRRLYLQPAAPLYGINVGAGMLSVANQWLETDVVIPPRAGCIHDFYCDCGERLAIPDDVRIAAEYPCAGCGKVYSGPDYDAAVRCVQHNRLAGAARSLAVVYGIEKDRAYAEKVAEILLSYADAYPGPHTDLRTGGMYRRSIDEAVWVVALAQAYDLIYHSRCIDEYEKERIEGALLRPVAESLKSLPIGGHWGSWHLSAVGVVGLAIKDPALVRWALDALTSQLSDQLGDDGLWPESVHTYHFHALRAFVHFAEACHRAGMDVYDLEPRPGKSLRTMFAAPLEYVYPSFRLPAIHDGWFNSVLPLDLYEVAHRRYGDPGFAWVLKAGYRIGDHPITGFQQENRGEFSRTSLIAFLFGRDLPGRTAATVLRGRDFRDLGICTLRGADDLMVTLDYGPYLDHGHLDKLGFTLFANGAIAMPDYGTPGFGSGLMKWSVGTAGHNTVVVDGKDQQRSAKHGLVHRYAGSYVQCAEAVADDCYPGVVHRRGIVVIGSTCIVADRLTSAQEHDYDWLVRCEGAPQLDGAYHPAELSTWAYGPVRHDQALRVDGSCALRWACENGDIAFRIWPEHASASAVLGECPTDTESRSASFFACRQRATDAGFLAVIAATKVGGEAGIARDGCVLRVETKDAVDHIFMRGWGDGSGSLETDGDLAAVRMVAGNVVAVVLVKGSWVKWNGEFLIECPCVVDSMEFLGEEHGPVIRYSCDTVGIVKIHTNARAMRVNGFRANASRSDGSALIRITHQMLASELPASNR